MMGKYVFRKCGGMTKQKSKVKQNWKFKKNSLINTILRSSTIYFSIHG